MAARTSTNVVLTLKISYAARTDYVFVYRLPVRMTAIALLEESPKKPVTILATVMPAFSVLQVFAVLIIACRIMVQAVQLRRNRQKHVAGSAGQQLTDLSGTISLEGLGIFTMGFLDRKVESNDTRFLR
jgi:hypothetical protein